MRREKYVAKVAPMVVMVVEVDTSYSREILNIGTLYHLKFKRHFKAENGSDGGKNRLTGSMEKTFILMFLWEQ